MYDSFVSYIKIISFDLDIKSLQLVRVTFPDQYINVLTQKQIQIQNITTNLNMLMPMLHIN